MPCETPLSHQTRTCSRPRSMPTSTYASQSCTEEYASGISLSSPIFPIYITRHAPLCETRYVVDMVTPVIAYPRYVVQIDRLRTAYGGWEFMYCSHAARRRHTDTTDDGHPHDRAPVVLGKNLMNSKVVLEIRSGDHSYATPIRRIGASLPRNTRRPPNNHRLFKRLILISNNEKRAASNMETAL